MKFGIIQLILVLIIGNMQGNAYAASNDDYRFDWMNSNFGNITSTIPACLSAPQFPSIHQSSNSLNLDNTGQWIPTGVNVSEGKLLQIEWGTKGVLPRPSKYKVLYRIDPRFEEPEVFIQKYDYSSDQYISDFYHYKNALLLSYQAVPQMTFSDRIIDFVNYFKFNGRSKIPVKKDDVINITLSDSGSYFGSTSEMNTELGSLDNLLVIYTQSALPDNRIIYTNAQQFCTDGVKVTSPQYALNCSTSGVYLDATIDFHTYEGRINNNAFNINMPNLDACQDSVSGKDNTPLCYYDKGRGMEFSVGGTTIKGITEKLVNSPFTGKDLFYYKSDVDGDLDFNTSWLIGGMFQSTNQFMKDWGTIADYTQFTNVFNLAKPSLFMNFLHFGRYMMDIEIGNSVATISKADLDAIKVEYVIMDSGVPDNSTTGISVERTFRGNAGASGSLWIRVVNPNNNLTGAVQVNTANYTGSTWFSDLVYGKLVKPLRDKFNELSKIIYEKLISNAAFQNIARLMLVLYIIIYGLMFLAGATKITVMDIVTRVLKIGVILALFSETSWTFFSNNLFNVFVDGIDSLMTSVVGITSQTGNVFGFVDPIFDKYTNGRIWALLFIQLLQIHTGLTFFAIMTIYALLTYFKAVLEVIVSYCLAFLGLAVMVSLAPFFIVLMLFERTKSMFDNWLSIMFSYLVQPTILLIFFLLIDQILSDHISRAVVGACWDTLAPIRISIDLHHIHIPISFSFTLPFLSGIPFYVPEIEPISSIDDFFFKNGTIAMIVTSSLLFFAICKLASGLVDYATLVVQYLTNVIAARQEGRLQKEQNPVKDITGDIGNLTSPVTNALFKVGKFAKEKIIDQKISHRGGSSSSDVDYNKFTPSGGAGSGEEPKPIDGESDIDLNKREWTPAKPSFKTEVNNTEGKSRTADLPKNNKPKLGTHRAKNQAPKSRTGAQSKTSSKPEGGESGNE